MSYCFTIRAHKFPPYHLFFTCTLAGIAIKLKTCVLVKLNCWCLPQMSYGGGVSVLLKRNTFLKWIYQNCNYISSFAGSRKNLQQLNVDCGNNFKMFDYLIECDFVKCAWKFNYSIRNDFGRRNNNLANLIWMPQNIFNKVLDCFFKFFSANESLRLN